MASASNDDLLKALRFFDGKLVLRRNKDATYTEPYEGLPEFEFHLSEQDEVESRAAIVRLLNHKEVPEELRGRLAGAFAPDGDAAAGRRQAKLKFRKGSRPTNIVRQAMLIMDVALLRHQQKMSQESAWAAVAERHGMGSDGVKAVWERNPDLCETIERTLPPQK